ncbi:MAG: acyl-CoA thioesterase [Chloroflexota bacterium]|nr:acyl-CoA thioesterase [Chloroflexota bacterium]
MGVVHHATYLAYFEVGRVEAFRQVGADYASVVARGLHLVVIEAHARYSKPARFDDVLVVETRAGELGTARFALDYRILRQASGELIATGRTVHACVEAASMRPVRLPPWLVDDLRRLR